MSASTHVALTPGPPVARPGDLIVRTVVDSPSALVPTHAHWKSKKSSKENHVTFNSLILNSSAEQLGTGLDACALQFNAHGTQTT